MTTNVKIFFKRTRAFKYAQNVRIHTILHMRKASYGLLLSTETYIVPKDSVCGQEGPDQTARSAQSDEGLRCPLTKSFDPIECSHEEHMPG